jgi:hypothetical protein
LGREGHHGAHRAHGEERRELRVDLFLIRESLLGVLGALCGSKKPSKKPQVFELGPPSRKRQRPKSSLEKNHGKDGKHRKRRRRTNGR